MLVGICVYGCAFTPMKLSLGAYTWGGKYVRRGICIVICVCVRVHLGVMHGFEAVWVHICGVACVWDICPGVCFVHVVAPAYRPGARVHTFIGQTVMAVWEWEMAHAPLPLAEPQNLFSLAT